MARGVRSEKSVSIYNLDAHQCPFREFRDNELSNEYWGLGPQAARVATLRTSIVKSNAEQIWFDEQTQPLPQSVRKYLYEWRRAEEVASKKFKCDVVLFEEHDSKMSLVEIQLAHPLVLKRSSFVRRVLSTCFMLERNESRMAEHQWESFSCSFQDTWRPKYHVYSPSMKPGGGAQHRPLLSKTGCYLVRLYYLGSWRCVWVNDQVPVTLMGVPLLPFAPLVTPTKSGPVGKSLGSNVTSSTIHLWPLLLCKALLKLSAPDISANSFIDEDELMPEHCILHALTGCMRIKHEFTDADTLWDQIYKKVHVFVWDDDADTVVSVTKRGAKNKPIIKDLPVRTSMVSMVIKDTCEYPPYKLPGITPAFEMDLIITMCRDLPLKKPLPEPEVPLWKTFRWVDWARKHGLYDAYECPRTKFLKVNGLLKLSHAPHLLDVGSTESITQAFRVEHGRYQTKKEKKNQEEKTKERAQETAAALLLQMKEELREWILFDSISDIVKETNILYYPSQFQFTTCTSHPVIKMQKAPNRALDIVCSKTSPLYLQLDSPNKNLLRISLSALHPRILLNCNVPIEHYVEPSYLLVEEFNWFEEPAFVKPKAFTETRGYDSIEVEFRPGRKYCRLWVHSQVQWHAAILSESTLLLGTRDVILCAAARDCPWSSTFLSNLGTAFAVWLKANRHNNANIMNIDRDFFKAYQPDLEWDQKEVGYSLNQIHWMFRQALQSMLYSVLNKVEFNNVCGVLRNTFHDPQFGFLRNTEPVGFTLQEIKKMAEDDPCVCPTPEESDINLTTLGETKSDRTGSEKSHVESVHTEMMKRLLTPADTLGASNICDIAFDDNVPCSYIREEKRKEINRHEAATKIQAYWRGNFTRKILTRPQGITADLIKLLHERLYGRTEPLSSLMNIFFRMFPNTKKAYSVSSALNGLTGLRQYTGNTHATPKCLWIPYFQGTFFCHGPVDVHFDIISAITYNNFSIWDNDSERQLHSCYNAHYTYKITPNHYGYTVIGHGTQKEETGFPQDINWQLTVLANTDKVFHVCDNVDTMCKESLMLMPLYKLHVEEVFLPNRKNILGSVQLLVTNYEYVNLRVVATSSDLEMIAVLQHITTDGAEEVVRCSGRGELFWPYIHLEGPVELFGKKSTNIGLFQDGHASQKMSFHSSKVYLNKQARPKTAGHRGSRMPKSGKETMTDPPNEYRIEVIASNGWPLSVEQWRRVDEIHNSVEISPVNEPAKKSPKEKLSLKDKKEEKLGFKTQPLKLQDGDAYVIIECSYPENGLVFAQRDDYRDIEFSNALKYWESQEQGRNARGAEIREQFRNEYLEDGIKHSSTEEVSETDDVSSTRQQGPSLASDRLDGDSSVVTEVPLTLSTPDMLKDKFKPLSFVPLCTKEKEDKPELLFTLAMADVEELERQENINLAAERMRELQLFNEIHQLERQKRRCQRIETLLVDGSSWNSRIVQAYEAQRDAIAAELLARSISANRKAKAVSASANVSLAGKRGRRGRKK